MALQSRRRERAELEQLIVTHKGSLSDIARALGCSRQYATRRIEAAGLTAAAASARALAGVPGRQRAGAAAIASAKQGARLLAALAKAGSDEGARARLGIPRRSFYRLKARLNITPDVIAAERVRLGLAAAI